MNRKILYAITALILLLAPLMASGAAYADETVDNGHPKGVANAFGHLSPQGLGYYYGFKQGKYDCNDIDPTGSEAIVTGFYWGD